jgi:putative ABC transport system permease protein
LFYPHVDPLPIDWNGKGNTDPSQNWSWPDARNLLRAKQADLQAAMAGGNLWVTPTKADYQPFSATGRFVTKDFFELFATPFRAGHGWLEYDEDARARLAVIGAALNHRLFGDSNGLGRTVTFNNIDFQVIGVLDDWRPQPLFYADLGERNFGANDEFFLPLTAAIDLGFNTLGSLSCWGNASDQRSSDHCTWLQFWVQLSSPSKIEAYRQFLLNYSREQKGLGRFPRPLDVRLYGLMEWLQKGNLVPNDIRLQMWLALGFLLVCITNIVGLLLTKFMARSSEASVRRALGARRRDVFAHFLTECLLIGVAGGICGVLLAQVGLWAVRQRADDYAHLAYMDLPMLGLTFLIATLAGLVAGLLPAWRICAVEPAFSLKAM